MTHHQTVYHRFLQEVNLVKGQRGRSARGKCIGFVGGAWGGLRLLICSCEAWIDLFDITASSRNKWQTIMQSTCVKTQWTVSSVWGWKVRLMIGQMKSGQTEVKLGVITLCVTSLAVKHVLVSHAFGKLCCCVILNIDISLLSLHWEQGVIILLGLIKTLGQLDRICPSTCMPASRFQV